MAHDPFDHVVDAERELHLLGDWSIPLPHFSVLGHEFQVTKFMVLELLAAVLIAVILIPLCRRSAAGGLPKGPFWNAFDAMLTYLRDNVAKPALGEHDADRFMPLLWTMFFFILVCNLLGMVPMLGSPTASIWVTGGLAFVSFVVMHGAAVAKMGGLRYLKSLWPHIHAPVGGVDIGPFIAFPLFCIELLGTVIKSGVLAVRLFANMFAGHMVLATILTFIVVAGEAVEAGQMHPGMWGAVTVASLLAVVALSLLELFVAFLQAYVFVFLTALFIGMSIHPQH